jgi:hypothetical protein
MWSVSSAHRITASVEEGPTSRHAGRGYALARGGACQARARGPDRTSAVADWERVAAGRRYRSTSAPCRARCARFVGCRTHAAANSTRVHAARLHTQGGGPRAAAERARGIEAQARMLTHPIDAAVRCARIAVVAVRVGRAAARRLACADVCQTGAGLLTEAVVGVGRPVAPADRRDHVRASLRTAHAYPATLAAGPDPTRAELVRPAVGVRVADAARSGRRQEGAGADDIPPHRGHAPTRECPCAQRSSHHRGNAGRERGPWTAATALRRDGRFYRGHRRSIG